MAQQATNIRGSRRRGDALVALTVTTSTSARWDVARDGWGTPTLTSLDGDRVADTGRCLRLSDLESTHSTEVNSHLSVSLHWLHSVIYWLHTAVCVTVISASVSSDYTASFTDYTHSCMWHKTCLVSTADSPYQSEVILTWPCPAVWSNSNGITHIKTFFLIWKLTEWSVFYNVFTERPSHFLS